MSRSSQTQTQTQNHSENLENIRRRYSEAWKLPFVNICAGSTGHSLVSSFRPRKMEDQLASRRSGGVAEANVQPTVSHVLQIASKIAPSCRRVTSVVRTQLLLL